MKNSPIICTYFVRSTDLSSVDAPLARKKEELPFQLELSGEYKRLKECLCDLDLFLDIFKNPDTKYNLFRWWQLIQKNMPGAECDPFKNYRDVLTFYKTSQYHQTGEDSISVDPFHQVALFLEQIASYEGAGTIFYHFLPNFTRGDFQDGLGPV